MAAAAASTSRRFAAPCGARGQYVKAAELAARPVAVPVRPLPLMPGADVPEEQEQGEAGPAPAHLTIVYGGRVLAVVDDVPADKAATLLRLASSAARGGITTVVEQQPSGAACCWRIAAAADVPVARKASLQRFMEKRKGRAAARGAPYRRPAGSDGDA
ncbi:unnamed protein product [Urochloa humidicola]